MSDKYQVRIGPNNTWLDCTEGRVHRAVFNPGFDYKLTDGSSGTVMAGKWRIKPEVDRVALVISRIGYRKLLDAYFPKTLRETETGQIEISRDQVLDMMAAAVKVFSQEQIAHTCADQPLECPACNRAEGRPR